MITLANYIKQFQEGHLPYFHVSQFSVINNAQNNVELRLAMCRIHLLQSYLLEILQERQKISKY